MNILAMILAYSQNVPLIMMMSTDKNRLFVL